MNNIEENNFMLYKSRRFPTSFILTDLIITNILKNDLNINNFNNTVRPINIQHISSNKRNEKFKDD